MHVQILIHQPNNPRDLSVRAIQVKRAPSTSARSTSPPHAPRGLKGIEEGVDEALVDIGRLRGIDWLASKSEMRAAGRYHVESY